VILVFQLKATSFKAILLFPPGKIKYGWFFDHEYSHLTRVSRHAQAGFFL
jgi:hypothetical protein